jgi:curli biogenesis system outer membrane secretion channel CsgG
MFYKKLAMAVAVIATVSGCAANKANWEATRTNAEEPHIAFSTQKNNLSCTKMAIAGKDATTVPVIGIGTIGNATGVFDYEGVGNYLPVDAGHMFVTAMKKGGLRVVTREGSAQGMFEWELDMAMKKVLGDKNPSTINSIDPKTGEMVSTTVPYRIVRSGGITGSDLLLIGSINRLDFDTSSGGLEIYIEGYEIGRRSYSTLVGMDLALVDTTTSEVIWAEQYESEYFGIENKAGVFKYESDNLVDINMGVESNQPLQAGLADMVSYASYDIANTLMNAGCSAD